MATAFTVEDIVKMFDWKSIDLIKIDIEGGEATLFAFNNQWINKVKQIVLEIHSGCREAVFKALSSYAYEYMHNYALSGESHIFKLHGKRKLRDIKPVKKRL